MWMGLLHGEQYFVVLKCVFHFNLQEQVGPFLAYKQMIVCNYAIGGNAAGKPMYKIGEPCSECDSGYTCENDLCVKA